MYSCLEGEICRRVLERHSHSPSFPRPLPPSEIREAAEIVLAALYLAGAPRGIELLRASWVAVMHLLVSECVDLAGAARILRHRGFRTESLAIESPGLLAWAERRVAAGVVLTGASFSYPAEWLKKLGSAAPPALWQRGPMPPGPYLAIVGSRRAPPAARRFAESTGREAAGLGYAVASGGAWGCDRAAIRGAHSIVSLNTPVEILPCGLNERRERFFGCALSPFDPDADFTAAAAMQRNTLLYALADIAVIVHSRLGEGGTWRGAAEARRLRLCHFVVRADGSEPSRALIALGAAPLESPSRLESAIALAREPLQRHLMDVS